MEAHPTRATTVHTHMRRSVGPCFVSSSRKMMAPAETFLICVLEARSSNRDKITIWSHWSFWWWSPVPTDICLNNISNQVTNDFVHTFFHFTAGEHSTRDLFINRQTCSYSLAFTVGVQSQVKLCGIYGGQSGTQRGFTAYTALSVSFHQHLVLTHSCISLATDGLF